MPYQKTDLSSGWKLGYCKETKLNKWVQTFGTWKIDEGRLTSDVVTGYASQIYANKPMKGDYTLEYSVELGEGGTLITFLNYSVQRIAYYGLILRAGSPIQVTYVFSALQEKVLAENVGEALEAGKKYSVKMVCEGKTLTLFLDGEKLWEIEDEYPCGRYTGFCMAGGSSYVEGFRLEDSEGTTFEDDFSGNSLARKTDVELSELTSEEWFDAEIPGTVHSSLLKAGRIEDPYVDYNGPKQMWIDDQRWIYKKSFRVPEEYRGKKLRIEFGGVDYHGWFWLNGEKLCYHEGMFGGPYLDVTDRIDYDGENELVVCLLPCPSSPHSNAKPYIFQRWHFNMDILTIGIWREVSLVAYENVIISDVQLITKSVSDEKAVVYVSADIGSLAMWPFDLKGSFRLKSLSGDDEEIVSEFAPGFAQGCIKIEAELTVPNPRLWWPNGMGEQNLYTLTVTADVYENCKDPAHTGHDEYTMTTGLRYLEMKPSPNKNATYNWVLSVNGKSFFGKGSNWMPVDQMMRFTDDRYETFLKLARDCNINILRPWGAGLFETDKFYELCDKYGICVWQEMLMANGFYKDADRTVWRDTMRQNILRLRNHPSLVMWCGGNEFDPDHKDNKDVVDDMEYLCRELDPSREFHRANPYGGDSHSYQVNWMEGAYYTRYTKDLAVAVTEFSMASPPNMDTLRKLIPEEEMAVWPPNLPDDIDRWDYRSWGENVKREESGFSMHDAHLSSITNIMFPPMSECGIPKSYEEFVSYMQTAHGMLTQFGLDFWRSRFPYCTMAMSWVFNEIFPSTLTWAYVDGYGVPKASYFYKKRSFEPLHITAIFDDLYTRPGETFRAKLSVINETDTDYRDAKIFVRLYDVNLQELQSMELTKNIADNDVCTCGFFDYPIAGEAQDAVMFLVADLCDAQGTLLSRSQYAPRVGTPIKRAPYLKNGPWISEVKNTRTELTSEIKASEEENTVLVQIRNTGNVPAFQVALSAPGFEEEMRYSDNFFWMEPGEIKEVRCTYQNAKQISVCAWNAEKTDLSIG